MIKALQQEAQCYFHNRTNLVTSYKQLLQPQQRIHFFFMLLYSQNSAQQLANFVAEALTNQNQQFNSLLTAVWAYSLSIQKTSELAKRLFSFVSLLQVRNLVDKSQLMSQLQQWVIQGAGIADQAAMQKRLQRAYTKINYEQCKYSLLRENNEGFAKLTLLLAGLRKTDDTSVVWKKIVSFIGNFDLDPDRVLDLIVESKLQNNESEQFLQLLRHFRKESVILTLGNMIQSQKNKPTNEANQAQKTVYCGPADAFDQANLETLFNQQPFTPNPRLLQLTAKSIKTGLFGYHQIQSYLEPSDIQIRILCGKRSELILSKINKSFTLSMVEIDQTEMVRLLNEQNLTFEGQLLYSTKLALMTQMVRCNDWTDFVAAWAPLKTRFDLLIYQPLLHALLDLLQWAISPIFKEVSFQRFFNANKKKEEIILEGNPKQFKPLQKFGLHQVQRISELLSYIGKSLAFRPRLYIKLCRMLKKYAKQIQQQEIIRKIKQVIKFYLVPANSYAENNAPISLELYQLLECFEYQFRYDCYIVVYRESMAGCPYTARIFESVKRRQNIIVNNLSKQNKKTFVRKIAKITHNQALPVLYWIGRRIVMQDYEAVVPEIVAVLSNSTPLTLDMTIFVMLYTLNQHKQTPVNIKTHQFQPWFKNVITFVSTFFRKYLEADIQPIFDYILMKTALPFSVLQDSDQLPGALLKLLHQILNKMYGSVMIQEVNKTKLDAIAAGPKLQAQILQLSSQVKAVKKSKVMLEKFFWQQNKDHHCGKSLAFNLLVLLCQKRGQVFTKAFIDDLRIMADIYDEYTLLIIQLVRVLFYQAQDYSHYAELLPQNPLTLLLQQYKLPLQYVCEIVRPGVKHIATMNQTQWRSLVSQFEQAYKFSLNDPKYLMKSSRPNEKVEAYVNTYKVKILEILPPSFLTAFWFLTIDSVYFPAKSYTQKIQDIKKKLQQSASRRNQKEAQKLKSLLEKLTKEQEQQRRKYTETFGQANLSKLQLQALKGGDKQKDKKQNVLLQFAQFFAQICLLPRMMLDRAQALYCVKFTIEMIKANKMPGTKSIRLLTFLMQYIMNYLPFTTHREASNCLSVFLAEILSIFTNWSDSVKLKQDMKRILGVEDNPGKDNYPKLRDYLVRLFERVGNIIKSIKQEPYVIKNCLYLLQKVESIPGYKQQADQLMQHMNELKELYTAVDMRTILDRQIAMLGIKKNDLPERPEEKKSEDKKSLSKPVIEENIKQSNGKHQLTSKSPLISNTNIPANPKPLDVSASKTVQQIVTITPHQQISKALQPNLTDRRVYEAKLQRDPKAFQKRQDQRAKQKSQSRFSDRPPQKQKQEKKQPPKQKQKVEESKSSNNITILNTLPAQQDETKKVNVSPLQNKQVKYVEGKVQHKTGQSFGVSSAVPPPKRFSDVKKQQELKSQGFSQPTVTQKGSQIPNPQSAQGSAVQSSTVQSSTVQSETVVVQSAPQNVLNQQRDDPLKTSPEQVKKVTIDYSNNLEPNSQATVRPTSSLNQVENHPKVEISKKSQERRDKSPLNSSKQIKIDRNRENNRQLSRDNKQREHNKDKEEKPQEAKWQRKREDSRSPQRKKDASRWKERDDGKRWEDNKKSQGFYSKDRKSPQRQGRERKQEKKDRQREKEKDKDRQKRHEKYRSRSRDKYSRR